MSTITLTNRVYGLKPWGPLTSAKRFAVRGSDSHVTYIGDVMATTTDGYVSSAAAGATNLVGPSLSFLTAGVTGTALIANDPDQLLQAQGNGVTMTQAYIGLTADHIAGAGSLTTKLSGHEINNQVTALPAAGGFTLQDFIRRSDNNIVDNGDVYVDAEVIVSHTTEHVRRVATGF